MSHRRWSEVLVAVIACLAMIWLHNAVGPTPDAHVTRLAVGQSGRLNGTSATVNSWTIGGELTENGVPAGASPVIFLAVNVTVAADGQRRGSGWQVGGESNGRTFAARDPLTMPEPGFRITQDVVFELSSDDLAGFVVTFLDRAPIYAYDPKLAIDLGITAATASARLERDGSATIRATRGRAEVNR